MRAQILKAFDEPYTFRDDLEKPQHVPSGDVLVRVLAASYCHTDAVYASGLMAPAAVPRIGGHEFAGEVVGHGEGLSSEMRDRLKVGTLVGVPVRAYHPCGECIECFKNTDAFAGYSVFCTKAGRLGVSIDGGFQDFVCVDARQALPIPSPLTPLEAAPLMCAGLTIFAAIQCAQSERKDRGFECKTLGIIGAGGGLGHLGIQFAMEMGFEKVVATDASDGALNVIKKVSQRKPTAQNVNLITVDARTVTPDQVLDEHFPCPDLTLKLDYGLDAVIMLPESQAAFDFGMKLLRRHGNCCVVSFPQNGFRFDAQDLIFRDIKIVGSLIGTQIQASNMLKLAAATDIRAEARYYSLPALNDLVEDYKQGNGGKLVVDMQR